jgi:hypothetical protein
MEKIFLCLGYNQKYKLFSVVYKQENFFILGIVSLLFGKSIGLWLCFMNIHITLTIHFARQWILEI